MKIFIFYYHYDFFSRGLRTHATKGGVVRPGRPPLAYAPAAEHASALADECTRGIDGTTDASPTYTKEEIRPIIRKCVEVALAEFDKQYAEKLAALNDRLSEAEAQNKQLRERLETVEKDKAVEQEKISNMETALEEVLGQLRAKELCQKKHETEINDLEQYSRRSHLRIKGLFTQHGESYKAAVARLCSTELQVEIKEEDLDAAHPLPQSTRRNNRNGQQKQQEVQPPVIIARFHRRDQRDAVIRARAVLKQRKIVISEDLTKRNQELLQRLYDSKQYTSSWSWMGKIFAIPRGETRAKKFGIHDIIPAAISQ